MNKSARERQSWTGCQKPASRRRHPGAAAPSGVAAESGEKIPVEGVHKKKMMNPQMRKITRRHLRHRGTMLERKGEKSARSTSMPSTWSLNRRQCKEKSAKRIVAVEYARIPNTSWVFLLVKQGRAQKMRCSLPITAVLSASAG